MGLLLVMVTPKQASLLPLSSPVTQAYQCGAVVCEEIPNI